jgi:carboxyl-terminal processing protease
MKEDKKKEEENSDGNPSIDAPTSDGSQALRSFKPVELGGKDDKQFNEALNILKGIDLYQKN